MNQHRRTRDHNSMPEHVALGLFAACLWLSACAGAASEPAATATPKPGDSSLLPTSSPRSIAPTATRWLPRTPTPTRLSTAAPIATATPWTSKSPTPIATPVSGVRAPDAIPLMKPGESVVVSEIHMIDASNGWAIGGPTSLEQTHILRTSDAGRTWADVTPPGSGLDFWSQSFLDAAHAWVLSFDEDRKAAALWRTRDGGISWGFDEVPGLIEGPYDYPIGIRFVDEIHGWIELIGLPAAGSAPYGLFRSEDGGRSWENLGSPGKYLLLLQNGTFSRMFVNPRIGWLLNAGYAGGVQLLRTEDAGASWADVDFPRPQAISADYFGNFPELDLVFASTKIGAFALSYCDRFEEAEVQRGFLCTTIDGGQSWSVHAVPDLGLPDPSTGFYGRSIRVHLATTDTAWADIRDIFDTGGNEFVAQAHWYRTANAGRTWEEVDDIGHKEGYSRLRQLDFINSRTGWALVEAPDESTGLYMTVDGGLTWTELSPQLGG